MLEFVGATAAGLAAGTGAAVNAGAAAGSSLFRCQATMNSPMTSRNRRVRFKPNGSSLRDEKGWLTINGQ